MWPLRRCCSKCPCASVTSYGSGGARLWVSARQYADMRLCQHGVSPRRARSKVGQGISRPCRVRPHGPLNLSLCCARELGGLSRQPHGKEIFGMFTDIGKLHITTSTFHSGGEYRGYWHISQRRPDFGDKRLRDRPAEGMFSSEEMAHQAAMDEGIVYARELLMQNPHWR